nr:fibronectin type III domain-containing protein [Clostridium kluyveri]
MGESETNSYEDTGLTASTTYEYKVSAVNAVGESALSDKLPLTTQPST